VIALAVLLVVVLAVGDLVWASVSPGRFRRAVRVERPPRPFGRPFERDVIVVVEEWGRWAALCALIGWRRPPTLRRYRGTCVHWNRVEDGAVVGVSLELWLCGAWKRWEWAGQPDALDLERAPA
jgi:hypothetical protein